MVTNWHQTKLIIGEEDHIPWVDLEDWDLV